MYVFLTVPDSGNGRIICQKIDENDSKEIKNYGGDNYFPRTLTYSNLRSLNTFNAPEGGGTNSTGGPGAAAS